MNEELMQEIKSTLPWLIVAALAVGGYYGVKNYLAQRKAAASEALVASYTTDDFEEAVGKFGSSDAAGALKLKLAKKYFDDARYDDAIGIYDELAKAEPEGFAGFAAVGRAYCLEGQGKFAEAKEAFAAFAAAEGSNPLNLTARLGAIRCQALAGAKDEAMKELSTLKESFKDDSGAKARVEALEDTLRRLAAK